MLIQQEDMVVFDAWTPADFAKWLCLHASTDMQDTLLAYDRSEPLPFVVTGDWRDQVEAVHFFLNKERKTCFEQGLLQVLQEAKPYPATTETFRALVLFVAQIRCRCTLEPMVDKILDPLFLEYRHARIAQSLFALVFNVVAGMTETTEDGVLLERLSKSPLYKSNYDAMLQDALGRIITL